MKRRKHKDKCKSPITIMCGECGLVDITYADGESDEDVCDEGVCKDCLKVLDTKHKANLKKKPARFLANSGRIELK